jgi:GT2 family glycosyltransferase
MTKGSVVVVAHNSGQQIEGCLEALRGLVDWEVLLVDNASSDNTLQRTRRFDYVRCVANSENRGFAAAVNQAVRLATGNVIVVLNPDAIAAPGTLDVLAQALHQPGVAAAGGLLLGSDGQPQRGFLVRRFPALCAMMCEILLLNRVWPANPCNRSYRCLDMDCTVPQEVEQPAGAAFAFLRTAWDEIGGMAESFYPVWFEDVDFCRRLHARGWKIMFCPGAVFRHAGGHSVAQMPFRKQQLVWYGNLLRYFRKYHPGWRVGVLRAAVLAGMLLRACVVLLSGGGEGERYWETIRAYLSVAWRIGIRGSRSPESASELAASSRMQP